MLKTGKPRSEGQIFHRRLLSEYIAEFTLNRYVSYFELKDILKRIEKLREIGDKKIREHINAVSTAYVSNTMTPVDRNARRGFPFPSHGATHTMVVSPTAGSPMKRMLPRHGSVSVFVDPICSLAVANMSPLELQAELIAADPSLASVFEEREVLQTQFFDALEKSYKKVKSFLIELEKAIVLDMVKLYKLTEQDLCKKAYETFIPSVYLKLESVLKYRELNLLAFRKILRKFLERCACDSLELQHRVVEIDAVISKSNVSQPTLDLREIALELMAIYGTVFKLTYEETLKKLQQFVARSGRLVPRILPMGHTFFSMNQNKFPPHQERHGTFAIRVLAGSNSLLSEKMITEVLQCPRYLGQSCGKFANGEVMVNLQGKLRGDDVFLVQSMVGSQSANFSNSDAVMELMLMIHSAQLAAAARITAVIPYLAYTRNVASIAAVAEMIEGMGCSHVVTVDMHSDQVEGMFSIPMESISAKYEFIRYLTDELRSQGNDFTNITIVAPNGNFLGKAKDFADAMMRYGELDSERQFISVCTAVKRLNTRTQRQAAKTQQQQQQQPGANVCVSGAKDVPVSTITTTAAATAVVDTPTMSEPGRLTPAMNGAAEDVQSPLSMSRPALPMTVMTPAPVAGGSGLRREQLSPTSPSVFDTHFSELDMVATNMGRMRRDETFSSAELEARSSSTLGMEKALKKQEEGRRAIVTHQVEETRKEYENYVLVGDVKNRLCVIIDTVIDEAMSICQVAKSLHANGAERIFLVATHAVLSGKYRERLLDAPIELIIVSDSVNQDEVMRDPVLAAKMRVVPIAPLLARAIEKIHSENTLTTMFEK